MIIMLMGIGALLISSNAAKKAGAIRQSVENVNFALDSMTRSIRMGTNYACSNIHIDLQSVPPPMDCPLSSNGGVLFSFTPVDDASIAPNTNIYYVLNNRPDGTGTISRCSVSPDNSTNCPEIVASNIDVKELKFYLDGSDPNDNKQPNVFILMKAVINVKGELIPFAVETMASQRSSE
jgi:hypothetical protein